MEYGRLRSVAAVMLAMLLAGCAGDPSPVDVAREYGRRAPEAAARHLALLQCPLLCPVRLAPGATREYESEYVLLPDVPSTVKELAVTYSFPAGEARSARWRTALSRSAVTPAEVSERR